MHHTLRPSSTARHDGLQELLELVGGERGAVCAANPHEQAKLPQDFAKIIAGYSCVAEAGPDCSLEY